MNRTRSRYDIRKGDMLEVTAWFSDDEGFEEADDPQSLNMSGDSPSVELVLVISDYGPHDTGIAILDSRGRLGVTLDSYVVKQYPGSR